MDDGGQFTFLIRTLIKKHPNFDPDTDDYDYAIAKLADKLNFTDTVNYIDLPNEDERIVAGDACWAVGWGKKKK